MAALRELSYVRLGTADLDEAVAFATVIVGLELVRRDGRSASFRSGGRDHGLVLEAGDPAARTIGFALADAGGLDAAGAMLERAGYPVRLGQAAECERRRVAAFIATRDPGGNAIEIVADAETAAGRFCPARAAGVERLAAIGLRSADARRDEAFWTGLFGARVSDWIGDAAQLGFGCRHHELALVPSAVPGLRHIDFAVAELDDLMRSYYFLKERGVRILFGPGRHPASGAAFLYFAGPDGVAYAYTAGARQIRAAGEAACRPRQFPAAPESWCLWGARPDPAFLAAAEPGLPRKRASFTSSIRPGNRRLREA